MTNPVAVSKFESKSYNSPDETRTPDKSKIEINRIEGFTIGRFNFEPGWRWSECIKPVVGTDSCQLSHVGYVVSGRLAIKLADGTIQALTSGNAYAIPPGHDAWVEGNEPFVGIEVMSADQFGVPQA